MPERPKVYAFDASGFQRVRDVVRRVEAGLPARGPEQGDSPLPSAVQVARVTTQIESGTRGTAVLLVFDAEAPDADPVEADELTVLNPFEDAVAASSIVAIAEVAGGGWIVLLESMTTGAVKSFRAPVALIKGYSDAVRQVLTHDATGELEWLDAEECP